MVCGLCGEDDHTKNRCPLSFPSSCTDTIYVSQLRPYINDIFKSLGCGHTESIYHRALEVSLRKIGLNYDSERVIPLFYQNRYVGYVRADLIVEDKLVIELKSSIVTKSTIDDSVNQCKCYMTESGISNGLIIIFPKNINEQLYILPIEL
jgi:GxxExxY protein